MPTKEELQEKRLRAWERGKQILTDAKKDEEREQPVLTAEERQEFDRVEETLNETRSEIDKLEAEEKEAREREALLAEHEAEINEYRSRSTENGKSRTIDPSRDAEDEDDYKSPEQRAAEARAKSKREYKKFMRWATDDTSSKRLDLNLMNKAELRAFKRQRELRAQSIGTTTEGGFTGPEGFLAELEAALLAFGGIRQSRARILRTATGNKLPMPMYDDTSNSGVLLSENTQAGEQDITFAEAELDSYTFSSEIIRMSVQLDQDSAFDMPAEIGMALGTRIGRIQNNKYTVGTGTSEPQGVVVGSTAGKTAASATAITFLELIDLQHSVDPAYRANAEFMFNDSTLSALRQLVDGNGFPIWMPANQGLSGGPGDRFLGTPYVINQDMASIATTQKTVLYGDFSRFYVRDVLGIRLVRMDERYADYLQIGFIAFARGDSVVRDAGTAPIKHLVQA